MATLIRDAAAEARPWIDIDPRGPMAHDLPHRQLRDDADPTLAPDRRDVCQFVAGGLRCQGTDAEHRAKWPELYRTSSSPFEAPPTFAPGESEAILAAAARDFHDPQLNDRARAAIATPITPALARRIIASAITNGDFVDDAMLEACERAITTGRPTARPAAIR